jgi:hypothetical protein
MRIVNHTSWQIQHQCLQKKQPQNRNSNRSLDMEELEKARLNITPRWQSQSV